VKLLPEAMSDVFDEIIDLKRALEYAKIAIKKCNGKWQIQETETQGEVGQREHEEMDN